MNTVRMFLLFILAASARDAVESGNAAYRAGRYDEAIGSYRKALAGAPNAPEPWFDLGDALYRKRDYSGADGAWDRAARLASDAEFEARCRYNQGNASYRRGVELSSANADAAVAALERAAKAYTIALGLDPKVPGARFNLDAARELIRRLRARIDPPPDLNEALKLDWTARKSSGGKRRSTTEKDW